LSWPLGLGSIGNRVNLMSDSIVTGYFLGAGSVAVLFLTQRAVALFGSQINSVVNASWAALGELRNTGKLDVFQDRVIELARIIIALGVTLTGTVAAFNSLFGCVALFTWILDTLGETRHRIVVSSIGSVLNIVLSVVFVHQIGLPGVVLGTIVAYLLTDAWYSPYVVCSRHGIAKRRLLSAVLRGLLVGLPWTTSMWWLANSFPPPQRWSGFALEALLVGPASCAYCWYAVLSTAERREWAWRLRGASRRS
jgi:O-antigen/teichoic acid export membrane protein